MKTFIPALDVLCFSLFFAGDIRSLYGREGACVYSCDTVCKYDNQNYIIAELDSNWAGFS